MTRSLARAVALLLLLRAAPVGAQVAPAVFSTVRTTDLSAISLCVGCPLGTTVPSANSGLRVATMTIDPYAGPAVTTNKLYNIAGALNWNGVTLATGSTISGTPNTIGLFTGVSAIGNSLLTQSGTTVTMAGSLSATAGISAASFFGSGAGLTNVPTTALTGNYVATVAGGTGLTSSAPTGSGANTIVSLNNTAVSPGAYPFVTVDQQGRVTAASSTVTGPAIWNAGQVTSSGDVTASGSLVSSGGGATPTPYSVLNGLRVSGGDKVNTIYQPAGNMGLLVQNGTMSLQTVGTNVITLNPGLGVAIGSTGNVTDAVAVPTIASGAGSGGVIVGRDYAFNITPFGAGIGTVITVNFNATYANAPICVASGAGLPAAVVVAPGVTQIALSLLGGAAFPSPSNIWVLCRGY